MDNFSFKQELFVTYLLNLFGIKDIDFIKPFLAYYEKEYGKKVYFNNNAYPDLSGCIDQLLLEKKIKGTRNLIEKLDVSKKQITASGMSNFSYCPASFSISSSFKIENDTGKKRRIIGVQLHEKLNLIKRIYNYQTTKKIEHKIFDNPILIKILNSKLEFAGHDTNQTKKNFHNIEKTIICSPDYIFSNNGEYFVVEEKYHYHKDPQKLTRREELQDEYSQFYRHVSPVDIDDIKKRTKHWLNKKTTFYKNHTLQVVTYLKNIHQYNLKFGYLVYWYYDFDEETPYIHKVAIKAIALNEYYDTLYQSTLVDMTNLIEKTKTPFDINNVSPVKCAACSVGLYCGHKSKQFKELEFPYNIDNLKLFKTEFPNELKKSKEK